MMNEQDVREIVADMLAEREANAPPACEYIQLMPVSEFVALDDNDAPLQVIGVALRDDGIPEWVVAKQDGYGGLVPAITSVVWPAGAGE